jgi:hypothetical protein
MKKGIVIALGLILLTGGLWAQEGFQAQLALALQQQGWTEEAAQLMVRQQALWRLAEGADPESVAFALGYALRNSGEASQLPAQQQAQLAVEVAQGLKEMNQLGFQNREAVGSMLKAMRQLMAQAGTAEQAGDLLRLRLRDRLRQLCTEDQLQTRLQTRQRGQLQQSRPDDLVPGGPSSGQHWGAPGGKS